MLTRVSHTVYQAFIFFLKPLKYLILNDLVVGDRVNFPQNIESK